MNFKAIAARVAGLPVPGVPAGGGGAVAQTAKPELTRDESRDVADALTEGIFALEEAGVDASHAKSAAQKIAEFFNFDLDLAETDDDKASFRSDPKNPNSW